ncbi:CBS domain-containing protein [uncultured Thiodictyon sp.]|uniref:CBS domain-containing protein n=1 Tax=uncultured Thiodictyon sp. TaxID=1846217 RepID=UPI0025CC02A0|nr:CBS domain-containing protein [uncultured Thiodictyon sp.]
MIIATTHSNTDFDALASMIAATLLYPGAIPVLPNQVKPDVREFLAVHWDLFRLRARKGMDLSTVQHLIVTDTSSWGRLDGMDELATREGLVATVWDHHLLPGTIAATELHREEVGATVTLLLEEIQARDLALSPIHATLFLLGIYDDTGSLGFSCTTARDAHMVGFLLENGADLNVVSSYLDSALDARHLDLFSRMLELAQTRQLGSLQLGVCVIEDTEKGLNLLPTVVRRFMEIKGLDAAFGVFPMGPERTAVIGRASAREFDVGAVLRQLGGGGHPGAGSAMVQAPVAQAHRRLENLIDQTEVTEVRVRTLMAPVADVLSPRDRLSDADAMLRRTGRQALLVVDEDGQVLGTFAAGQLAKVQQEREWDQPVTAKMRRGLAATHPDRSLRESLQLMSSSDLGFLPVLEDGVLVGEITRGAIILSIYDF